LGANKELILDLTILRRAMPFWLAVLAPASPIAAEVVRVEIARRVEVFGGRVFGQFGAYQLIEGRMLFALDPANRSNARIVDLALAPRNGAGKVEVWADFAALRPTRPAPDGVALFEVSNRGLKYLANVLDYGTMAAHPSAAADFGDALLLDLGLTIVWVGWQHDVPADPDRLGLSAPVARGPNGESLTGLVRSDWVVPRPVRSLGLAHGNHVAYPPVDPDGAETVLTVRDGRYAPRRVVPRSEWKFAREVDGKPVPDSTAIYRDQGFEPGRIYELVYRSRDPKVAGVGLAAIRDAMSWAKYDPASPVAARHAIGFGISQTGRLLRHFIYQGFNTDEQGRKVFDGLLVHIAGGGRGSFNHRFAQPSRDAHRYDAFFFPTDLFPFASAPTTDPVTGAADGLYGHQLDPTHLPLVFQTNSGYEYWGRAASTIHTSPDGTRDVDPPPNERIYLLAGAQHVPGPFPPPETNRHPGARAFRNDPLDYRLPLRALLVGLVDWVKDGKAPPPSAYPRIDRGDLVAIDRVRLPVVPDLGRPAVLHQADRLDFGPRWTEGIIDREPPGLGPPFPSLVAQVDQLGNEIGGIRTVELEAPLASYLPWNLRKGLPGDTTELTRILGTLLPLPRTEAERRTARDPRPSIASRYPSREAYLARARKAAESLVERRMLLRRDVERAVARAAATWDWVAQPAGPGG
jgi:hypothetical protein